MGKNKRKGGRKAAPTDAAGPSGPTTNAGTAPLPPISKKDAESAKFTENCATNLLNKAPNCLKGSDIGSAKDHSSFLKQIETAAVAAQTAAAAEVKPQIIEKIVEKIVQDPSLVKQLEEMKLQNEDLQKKIELQNEEKLSLESEKSSGEEQTRRITALEIENKSLEGRIVYYQDVLSNTETLLKTLESSVESEEASWKEKLVQKEEVIQQLNADKINLTLRTSELQAALDKVQQAEEMESQMNALKDKLNKEEIEKTNLKEQLQIVQEQLKVSNLSQIEGSTK